MSRGKCARLHCPPFSCHQASGGESVPRARLADRGARGEIEHERCQVGRHREAFSDSASEPTPIRASVARTGTKCHMRSRAQEVPFGGAPHLERRSDTARVSTTRPDCGLPLPTGKLSNSSPVITVCDPTLAGRRLREIDHRSLRDHSVLDEVPQGDQQLPGNGDDSGSAQTRAAASEASLEPLAQLAVWLESNP